MWPGARTGCSSGMAGRSLGRSAGLRFAGTTHRSRSSRSRGWDCAAWPGRSCAAGCSARPAGRSCAGWPWPWRPWLSRSFRLPKTIARVGQAAWQAVTTSSPPTARSSISALIRAVVDPLHAVRALLHHPAGADRHVGVAHQLQARRRLVGILEEVEPADLVRAVVRAVPRADAAVVGHLVEPLGAVRRRADRADELAGGLLAVHAGHRLEVDVGVRRVVALEVAVDPEPVHLARARGPAPCRRPGCCSRPGRPSRRRCSRCRC